MKKLLILSLSLLIGTQVFAGTKSSKNNCQKLIAKLSASYKAECKYTRTTFDDRSDSKTTEPQLSSFPRTSLIKKSSSFFSFEESQNGLPVLNLTLAPSFEAQENITDFRITCTKTMIETTYRSTLNGDKSYQRIRILQDGTLSGMNAVTSPSVIDYLSCIFTPNASI